MDFWLLLDDDISGTITDNIGITDKLVPNLWAFLTQLLAFAVMCVAVIFLAYKPIHRYLQKRQDYIANNLADSEKNKREAEYIPPPSLVKNQEYTVCSNYSARRATSPSCAACA